MTLTSSESKLPGNWPAIWSVAEQIVTLRWRLQVVSLKLDTYDLFHKLLLGQAYRRTLSCCADLAEPVGVEGSPPRCRQSCLRELPTASIDGRSISPISNTSTSRKSRSLPMLRIESEQYDNIHVSYCKQVMRYAQEFEARLDDAVECNSRRSKSACSDFARCWTRADSLGMSISPLLVVSERAQIAELPVEGRPFSPE